MDLKNNKVVEVKFKDEDVKTLWIVDNIEAFKIALEYYNLMYNKGLILCSFSEEWLEEQGFENFKQLQIDRGLLI